MDKTGHHNGSVLFNNAWTSTRWLVLSAPNTTTPQEIVQDIVKGLPLSRMGTPEDLVGMCLFLLSDEASWITGQIFNVDGGQIIRS